MEIVRWFYFPEVYKEADRKRGVYLRQYYSSICFRVLKLMELSDGRLSTGVPGNLKLEMAFLYTLEQFRKVYVSDQIQKLGRVYDQLEKNLGLQDESAVLVVYVRKMYVFCWNKGKMQSWLIKLELWSRYAHICQKLDQLPVLGWCKLLKYSSIQFFFGGLEKTLLKVKNIRSHLYISNWKL